MLLTIWVVVDPKLGRPYTSVSPPANLDRSKGVKLYKLIALLPDAVKPDDTFHVQQVIEEKE